MSADAAAISPTTGPLDTVGEAMNKVADALADGVGEATANVHEALPKMDRFVTRGVYKGSYYLAYGIVFPTAAFFFKSSLAENRSPKESSTVLWRAAITFAACGRLPCPGSRSVIVPSVSRTLCPSPGSFA